MKKQQHLLLFRFSAMGDVAILVPVLRCLIKEYPSLKITLVTRKLFIPLFNEFPNIDFVTADFKGKHKGIRGLWTLFKELKKLSPTAIADCHGVLRTHLLFLFFKLSFYSIGQIDKGRREKKQLTRTKNKILKPLTPSIYRYVAVLAKLGFPIDLLRHEFPPPPLLSLTSEPFSLEKKKKWIGIAPFASYEGKTYPLYKTQQLVAYLQREHQVFLFGAGKSEVNQLNIWEKNYSDVVSIGGKYPLKQELELIAHLDLMIAMDSANAHLAANLNVQVLTIWGLTHPFAGFSPWNQPLSNAILPDRKQFPLLPTSIYGNKMPKGYDKVFNTINPKEVIEKALELLT